MTPRTAFRAAVLVAIAAGALAVAARADGMPEGVVVSKPSQNASDAVVAKASVGPNDVWVAPGEEVALRVAQGHINRVETPFPEFDIWTESSEEFEQRGHVFYVSPGSDRPISMFVTPKGDERLAFSLMLIPAAIPPAQIRLRLGSVDGALPIPIAYGPGAAGAGADRAPYVEATPAISVPSFESGPYEDSLAALVKEFVVGMVPQGYAAAGQTGAHPRCRNVGAMSTAFGAGQRFIGPAFEVFIGVAVNDSGARKTFDETWCAGPDVAAVALWPSADLGPGQRAEVLVVRRRAPVNERPMRMRASLVGIE